MDPVTQKITRTCAYAVIIENGKLLLCQKRSGPFAGLWDLPGGGIEFGESPEEALKREIAEEAAFAADGLELLTVLTHRVDYLKNGNAFQLHLIGIIYRVNYIIPLPNRSPDEEKRWLSIAEIVPDELTPLAKQVWANNYL